MTRVSDNSAVNSLNYSINKAKKTLENLQIKGANLRNINRPSDNPVNNVEALALNSISSDNQQYLKNINFGLMQLNISEKSLEQITDILVSAKDIAIAQSSDFYNEDIRKNISNEIDQLKKQTLAIGNKRIGNKYIFSGHSTLTAPFDKNGNYNGDLGKIAIEVSKDFFVPINLNGAEVFYNDNQPKVTDHPLESLDQLQKSEITVTTPKENLNRFSGRSNIFSLLEDLKSSLNNNDPKLIQSLLEKFDETTSRIITLRTKVGSITKSVESAKLNIESENIDNATRKSQLVDADVAKVFSDLTKQQQILKTTYQSGKSMMNQNLLDFIR